MNALLNETVREEINLEGLEELAKLHYSNALQEWAKFVEICQQIRDSGLWESEATPTWGAYCKKRLPVGAERIKQYRLALPYAELIEQTTGFHPTENQVRNLREVVKEESRLIEVYRQAAELYEGEPAKRHFQAINEVLEQVDRTGAVSVAGESAPVTPVTLSAAMQESCLEADLRFKQNRQGNKANENADMIVDLHFRALFQKQNPDKKLPKKGSTIRVYYEGE